MGSDPAVGTLAPDFELPASTGAPVKLSDYRSKRHVVLFFYPKDGSPGCTAEACTFRDQYEDFVAEGAEVIGISEDSPESHDAFAEGFRLPFVLLSDTENVVRKRYGIKATLGIIPGRETFVIDKTGTIRHHFSSQLNIDGHIDQALKILRRLHQEDPA